MRTYHSRLHGEPLTTEGSLCLSLPTCFQALRVQRKHCIKNTFARLYYQIGLRTNPFSVREQPFRHDLHTAVYPVMSA